MKLKKLKKKIETTLIKRIYKEKEYIVLSSNIKNTIPNSYNILKYSLKYSIQKNLNKPLINNFLKSSYFIDVSNFNLFISNLKTNTNLIYFIKFKNLYIFNFDSNFKNFNVSIYDFMVRLQKLFYNWLFLLKLVIKNCSK